MTVFIRLAYASLDNGLIHYYRLDWSLADDVGNKHGTNNGATRTTGKFHGAFSFDGSDDYITVSSLGHPNDEDRTYALWFKTSQSSSFGMLFEFYQDSGNRVFIGNDNNGKAKVQFARSSNIAQYISDEVYADGNWHLIVVTVNTTSNEAKVYIDGSLKSTLDISSSNPDLPTKDLMMGHNPTYGDWYDGLLDEVMIWNRALSSDEVSELWNSGKGKVYDKLRDKFVLPLTAGLVAYYTLGGDAIDSTGEHHGTVNGATETTDAKIGKAMSFDGSNDYIELPSELINSEGSVAVWFKLDSTTADQMIVDNTKTGVSDYLMIRAEFNNNRYRIVVKDVVYFDTTSPRDNNWHFIVVTWNTSQYKYYFDGELITTQSCGDPTSPYKTFLGVQGDGDSSANTRYLDGIIDEVGIWNRPLTSEEISELYNSGQGKRPNVLRNFGLVSYYTFEDGANDVHSCHDGTENGAITESSSYGNIGKGRQIDAGEYITIANNEDFKINENNPISVYFWVNATAYDNNARIIHYYNPDGCSPGYQVWINSDGTLTAYAQGTGGTFSGSGSTNIEGAYHMITYVINPQGTTRVYVDSSEDFSFSTSSLGNVLPSEPFYIFNCNQGGCQVTGVINELGLWRRLLAKDEVLELYNSGEGKQYPFDPCIYSGSGDWEISLSDMCVIDYDVDLGSNYLKITGDSGYVRVGAGATIHTKGLYLEPDDFDGDFMFIIEPTANLILVP